MSEENDPNVDETNESNQDDSDDSEVSNVRVSQEKAQETDQSQESEEPKEEMSDLTRVAHEVLHGAWSEGKDRQKLLIDAGYNPFEVEEEVNRLQSEKE